MADNQFTRQINHVQPKGGRRIVNHAGKRFGRLIAISFEGFKNGKGNALWSCLCDCGQYKITSSSKLVAGVTASCGCYAKECRLKHGMLNSPEYRSWCHAKGRCCNPTDAAYEDYGGRGITMCQEWQDSFQAFYDHIGPRPKGRSLDRIDNEKGYEPGNVQWATHKQQTRNQRTNHRITHDGETLTIAEWAERTGIKYATIHKRIEEGRPPF